MHLPVCSLDSSTNIIDLKSMFDVCNVRIKKEKHLNDLEPVYTMFAKSISGKGTCVNQHLICYMS